MRSPGRPSSLIGIPFDRPVVGYGGKTINTLRLWAAAAPRLLQLSGIQQRRFCRRRWPRPWRPNRSRGCCIPTTRPAWGRGCALCRSIFSSPVHWRISCGVSGASNPDWNTLPEKVAIQLNDTHPAMAVPELMRILLDEAHLGWDQAWDLTRRTLAYTNHTLLPEALEKWPLAWFEMMLPRHLEIIFEINRRLLDEVRTRFPGDEGRVERVSLVEEGAQRKVRMANLAIVGSHSTNGVAAIHSQLLRTMTVKDLAEMFPERFNNKTNGVTPRRWLLLANPALARVDHRRDRRRLDHRPEPIEQAQAAGRRQGLSRRLPQGQARGQGAVCRLAQADNRRDRGSRHHLRLPGQAHPRIQAAIAQCAAHRRAVQPAAREPEPGYDAADVFLLPARRRRPTSWPSSSSSSSTTSPARSTAIRRCAAGSRSCSCPDYSVSLAERLIPASDVSNQISTAGYEASGTSNMKFMMNGALTIGTRDGATIEMAEEAGEENFFLFGLNGGTGGEQPRLVQPALALRQ